MKNCRGFTLLEVIIALGIVAVGILAVSRAITGFAETTLTLEQRMVASWVASNRLETYRILKTPPVVGTSRGSEEMAGRVWYFRETTTTTADPNLFRLDIVVFTDRDETKEAGSIYGYTLNYEAVNQPIITGDSQPNKSMAPLTERNWIPAFAGMTKAQITAITGDSQPNKSMVPLTERNWIPAFAGMTKAQITAITGDSQPNKSMTPLTERNWIPAFAGMTKAQITAITGDSQPNKSMTPLTERNWIPAFAGMTDSKYVRHCTLRVFPAVSSNVTISMLLGNKNRIVGL